MAGARDNSQLYITISYGKPGGGGEPPEKEPERTQQERLMGYFEHELVHLIRSQTIKAINSSVGMIGNLTGEYFKQMKIQEALNQASFGVSLVLAGIGGMRMAGGHPLGAVIGVGVALVGEGVSWGFDRKNFEASMSKQTRDIELLRQRSGLNQLYDGSRGTEN